MISLLKHIPQGRLNWAVCGLVCLGLGAVQAQAGGPLSPTQAGSFLRWNPANPVPILIDQGPLREFGTQIIPGPAGEQLVREVLAIWNEVAGSTIEFEVRGLLAEDVTSANYQTYANLSAPLPDGNPIIFDADGGITNAVLGTDASRFVLGFASASITDNADEFYDAGFAILNGTQASVAEGSLFRRTVLHELGHLLGLDHTQAGLQFLGGGDFNLIPVMFPVIVPASQSGLLRDDKVWLSYLYPDTGVSEFGTIRGEVRRVTGSTVVGVNVVAVPLRSVPSGSPLEDYSEAVSVVTGFLLNNGGQFEIPGLSPGDHALFIEPLDDRFVAGSGIGPFDSRFADFEKDYFNGPNEGADSQDDPSERTPIHVTAGSAIEDLIMLPNEGHNDLASLGDDDEELFRFPPGFRFPLFGESYEEVVVNSDGNLTFGSGDSEASPRTEGRFLTRQARIAPLFTDLNPEAGGQISAVMEEDALTFRWDDVPEFSTGNRAPGNDFSVTLFSNGNILFRYDDVEISPDGTLQAIVGVSPGTLTSGTDEDLSSTFAPIELRDEPRYEVFENAEFDLTGRSVLLQVHPFETQLLFPYFQSTEDGFTGLAATNDGSGLAALELLTRGADGELVDLTGNPRVLSLELGTQFARLGREIFVVEQPRTVEGWVELRSNRPDLASFFQFGNGILGITDRLDGSEAWQNPVSRMCFSRIYEGPDTFPMQAGRAAASTILSIVNAGESAAVVRIRLNDSQGVQLGTEVSRELGPGAFLRSGVSGIFGITESVSDGYVDVTSDDGQLIGFSVIETEKAVLGLNPATSSGWKRAFSAQLASGSVGDDVVFTSLKLINLADVDRHVTLSAIDGRGNIAAQVGPVLLAPGQSLQDDLGRLFDFGDLPEGPFVGTLEVGADGPGLVGDVIFGESRTGRFAASVPLQHRLFRRATFSQVASRPAIDPMRTTFTGLALYNAGSETAQVDVRVFRRDGALSGQVRLLLGSGERHSEVLSALVPEARGQEGGYITVDSTQPLVAQQLFGNIGLDFLSAVPPTIQIETDSATQITRSKSSFPVKQRN